MKVTYKVSYCLVNGRLYVDAWDIYNQLVNVLSEETASDLRDSFNKGEKKAKGLKSEENESYLTI